jgi:hypothetical protein
MHPILIQIGPVVIRYYGLMYVIAIAVGFLLLAKEARRKQLPLSTFSCGSSRSPSLVRASTTSRSTGTTTVLICRTL